MDLLGPTKKQLGERSQDHIIKEEPTKRGKVGGRL